MRKIYEHIEFERVGHFQSILESVGISTHIKNLGASGAAGEIVFTQVYPELWVVNDSDYDRALEVLEPYYRQETTVGPDWVCSSCGSEVGGAFGECWKCQAPAPRLEPGDCGEEASGRDSG